MATTFAEIPEYAPERSTRERVTFVMLAFFAGLLAVLLKNKFLIPWIKELGASNGAPSYFGLPGTAILGYLLFVGIPASSALITSLLVWRGCKILKFKQVPPPGERVFRKTLIRRGRFATIAGYAHFVPTILLLALAVWGIWQAEHFTLLTGKKDA